MFDCAVCAFFRHFCCDRYALGSFSIPRNESNEKNYSIVITIYMNVWNANAQPFILFRYGFHKNYTKSFVHFNSNHSRHNGTTVFCVHLPFEHFKSTNLFVSFCIFYSFNISFCVLVIFYHEWNEFTTE